MIIAHIEVSGVSATCKRRSQIPARLVGGQVAIEYADPVWAGLNKTAVFRGSVTKDVLNVDKTVVIPPEVVAKAGADLHFGIEGRSPDGTLVIPLIEAYLGKVSISTNPSGDASADPSLPVWQQILVLIGDLDDLTTEAKNTLVAAINEAAGKGGGTVDEETVWEIVDEYLQDNPPQVDVPVKLSQLENDSGFVDRLVSDLQNYYLKSQTYTRDEIDGKISAIPKFSIKAVQALPTADISETTVYLLSTGSGSDLYTEYIYVDGEWEVLGSQRVDLSGYATEEWASGMFQPKGNYLTEHQSLEGYAKTEEIPTKISQLQNDKNYLTEVPDGYAKTEAIPTKPEDIGAQPEGNYALKSEIPSVPVQSVNGKTGTVQLGAADVGARPDDWMPTAAQVGALPSTYKPPDQTAQQVGADPAGTAASAVSGHNTNTDAHNDLRLELKAISDKLNAFFDSDDQTLDELSEIVAYIKSNKTLIDSITTSKVNVADIINNLTTNVANKPLSAAQGVALKALIAAITVPTKLSQLTNDKGFITGYTETDPTVPSWAKQAQKPSYNASEIHVDTNGFVDPVDKETVEAILTNLFNDHADLAETVATMMTTYVETSRKINGKALNDDITLSASDVGAVPTTQSITVTGVDADGVSHSWTMYGVAK